MKYNADTRLNSQVFSSLHDCKTSILNWLDDECIEPQDKSEIEELIDNENAAELRDRFYKEIEFGTGGLRGIMGNGCNRLNKYVVRRVVQGFANYILKCSPTAKNQGVAIAYDSRNNSHFFAQESARVLCANGIGVFLFPTLQTTPALSYAIRKLKCTGGLCFTASHNPPQYNGIKVYWSDGAQIIPPQDAGILSEVFAVSSFSQAKHISLSQTMASPYFKFIDDSVLQAYYQDLKSLSVTPDVRKDLKIVFTPLHGTGKIPALAALNSWGFHDIFVVPEQGEPDGNFPSVQKPNPEEPQALKLAIEYATAQNSDIVFATDPDSDRLALAVHSPAMAQGLLKHQSMGDYVLLNGNQTGALLIDHILKNMRKNGSLKAAHKVITTIVTSELHDRICQSYDIEVFQTLTGFKWIAGLVRQWEESNKDYKYLFGTEESFGYMPGNFVRDKDAIGALCLAAEMTAHLKDQGLNLCDALFQLFEKHGAWQEDLVNVDLYGEEGVKRIQTLMGVMRASPILSWNGVAVKEVRDFTDIRVQSRFHIPHSNVLQFYLDDGSKISMRPSGTEPKLKYYISTCTQHSNVQVGYAQSVEKIEKIKTLLHSFTINT